MTSEQFSMKQNGRKVGEVGMILIDLPMPEACDVCPFNYDFCWCNAFGNHDEKWEKYSDDWNDHVCDRETRPEYCPLKEIVRCKDCKHGKIHGIDVECVAHEEISYDPEPWHPLDWFCADGERRDST